MYTSRLPALDIPLGACQRFVGEQAEFLLEDRKRRDTLSALFAGRQDVVGPRASAFTEQRDQRDRLPLC
jgi:hypothetical protein